MSSVLNWNLRCLCSKLWWSIRRRLRPKIVIRRSRNSNPKAQPNEISPNQKSSIHLNGQLDVSKPERIIRVATFNAAMFSMAPAVPKTQNSVIFDNGDKDYLKVRRTMEIDIRAKSINDHPKSILKQSPLHPNSINYPDHYSKQQKIAKSNLRVSINLPDNEISVKQNRHLSRIQKGKAPIRSNLSLPTNYISRDSESFRSNRTVVEVLREVDADILALQDVKAEEEKDMKPLSDLAGALGMQYVFAESWAPEYGNAVLSKWPIKRSEVQKIFDDMDFRNVLKATVDVPESGEINFHCTHLDHLDENWRMKQINAIIQSNNEPHLLAGGLNSLDETDYSAERWMEIIKYYEEIGKPKPKVEVMKFLKGKEYIDAKDFNGECESVVMITKGQSVQGTSKYGTRVDYIMASQDLPYKFVPGSYSVISSKGTSDHHIVKVDIVKDNNKAQTIAVRQQPEQNVVKITNPSSSKGIWRTNTRA